MSDPHQLIIYSDILSDTNPRILSYQAPVWQPLAAHPQAEEDEYHWVPRFNLFRYKFKSSQMK